MEMRLEIIYLMFPGGQGVTREDESGPYGRRFCLSDENGSGRYFAHPIIERAQKREEMPGMRLRIRLKGRYD